MKKLILKGETWTESDLHYFWELIDNIGKKWGIDYPKTQIEIVSSEQMIDVIAAHGEPCTYDHWSLGKRSMKLREQYKHGQAGLAYELIINSDPTIMYIAENNTLMQQGLVMAHAGIGHGAVFKNNYLFKRWTRPDSILDYFAFSRQYIKECELKYGSDKVEYILDLCHGLAPYSISHHIRKSEKLYKKTYEDLMVERTKIEESMLGSKYKNIIQDRIEDIEEKLDNKDLLSFPEENVLYFIEKKSKLLPTWAKEIVRINRKYNEYFFPQIRTKILHEGWATFIEYMVFNELYTEGHIDEGGYLEFLRDHANVTYQPDYDSKYYQGHLNPYAIGFHIFQDLYRMTTNPTAKDKRQYPEICDTRWQDSLMEIVKNYSDVDFINKYLTDNVIKNFKLFAVDMNMDRGMVYVDGTASDCDTIREYYSKYLDPFYHIPRIEVTNIDNEGRLEMTVCKDSDREIDPESMYDIVSCIEGLWGKEVCGDITDCD